ncbi:MULTISPECIES: hypothetical protein [unclassified Cupriavidus]|uniref:hypothetical protein n=1 Tax=unclassified Cupriavidus TaxID=2640874 RepID=UPI000E9873CB|nr:MULTISPECIES: hypothetical protein [unclassified Cupriavidus]HBD37094.1 hypothetical protein [Cupriavidus sp.]HBO83095.1 hypothetical protein [Cupriavidus sp.]
MEFAFAAAWILIGAALAAVYQLGFRDGQGAHPQPAGSALATVLIWPVVVAGAIWHLIKKR